MKYFSENLYNFFYNFFEINAINSYFYEITSISNNELYLDKQWLYFSNMISAILISFFIILLGIIFPNKAKIIKFLNLISAFYLLIFFFLMSSEYIYDLNLINNFIQQNHINDLFQQNHNLYVNFFFILATITTLIFFLSICDIFYLEENMKIEYTLLVLYIYISAILLISSLDFISIIILLECIAFSSYVLVGFERKNKFSTSSALKYLILAAIPSGFFILGISILYNNYGSFYQDYLDLLIVAFEKNNITSMDWYYIIERSFSIENVLDLNSRWKVVYESFLSYAQYINNILSSNQLVQFIFIISSIEFNIDNLLKDFLYEDINSFKEFYINLYMHFLDILETVTLFFQYTSLWTSAYTLNTENIIPIEGYTQDNTGINESMYVVLNNIFDKNTNNINRFLGFLSYYNFVIGNYNVEGLAYVLKNLNYSGEIQKINLKYLFDTTGTLPSICDYFYFNNDVKLDLFVNEVFNTLKIFLKEVSFLKNNQIFIVSNDYSSFIKYYNDLHLVFFYPQLFFNAFGIFPEISQYLSKEITFTTFFGLNYDNIFLSTYLVIIFLLINLSFKITAAPFHFWAPSVYGGSPLPTITFLSVFSKLTIIFLFINLFLTVFEHLKFIWQPILFFLGVFSILISIIGAFSEKLFKRFFIYSSIGHVGFMILGLAVLNYSGIQGAIDYLILYVISSFIVWFIVMHLTKKTTHLISFKGLSFNYPTLSLILVIALFSISGLPPMGGFFVKFEIFYSLINSSQYFIAYILFILTVFSFFYYLRLIKIIYFEENKLIKKNKNLNDIKLRLISILIFILPLYILFLQEPFFYILKESIITSF
jgi:NADH:ubiquinone oxidoreductase subunit 2 (subunit N)